MLQLTNLTKTYPTPQGPLHVLDGVDLQLAPGESLALMGSREAANRPCCIWPPVWIRRIAAT
ncbi:hypothetical protein [Modicisalibacter luteus]|uniref:hypothetical protein n=1 Tax=Modicisalibacter luteus TaxID=453962 RepID=UPI00363ED3FB